MGLRGLLYLLVLYICADEIMIWIYFPEQHLVYQAGQGPLRARRCSSDNTGFARNIANELSRSSNCSDCLLQNAEKDLEPGFVRVSSSREKHDPEG